MMKLSDFDYTLPKELIAQYPLKERGSSRMLVLDRKDKSIAHRRFADILEYIGKEDLLVLNDTRVLPARIPARRLSGGKVEVLLLGHKEAGVFEALIRPGRVKLGEKLIFNGADTSGTVTARNEITFSCSDAQKIYSLGKMPLPPYIKREPEDMDNIYYQTVYAANDGAIAAPTAGLHFTRELLDKISSRGTKVACLTLHVGYPTFRPVKALDIKEHEMDREFFRIGEKTIGLIKETRNSAGRIFCVGTTTCRALESYARGVSGNYTDLFIYPGYKFRLTDCLLTNFHLPRTTLFMLVCAFAGTELAKKAYRQAVENRYRFYSYGDAMLII